MATFPWFPFYVGDYRRDTSHLSPDQHGAYILLLCHEWVSGPLPDDDGQLARIVGMTRPRWRRCRATVMRFFRKMPAGWISPRLETERDAVAERSRKQSEAAKSMWEKKRRHATAYAKHDAKQMVALCNHKEREELIQDKQDASASSLSSDSGHEGRVVPLRGRQ